MYKIENSFEGANIKVISLSEDKALIDVELRDTTEDWFYWCFRVIGAAGRTVRFEFPSRVRVGYFGAAVSHDYKNWHWQYDNEDHSGDSFTYTFGEKENEVYFAHDFCYRPDRFFEFAFSRMLEAKTLCKSEKGRDVPYLDIGDGNELILLTARHHACESTGSYVLEGVLDGLLSDQIFSRYRIICVPMVDIDGVTDGDQGKFRSPYDHNRDYRKGEEAIYSAVREIRRIADKSNVKFAFDFHSPWHIGNENDNLFIPIKNFHLIDNVLAFSDLFEARNNNIALPHHRKDNIMPGERWNKSGAPGFGYYMGELGAELSFTLETPYFKAGDTHFSVECAYETGKNFVSALKDYILR